MAIPSVSIQCQKYEILAFFESPSITSRACLAFSDHCCQCWQIALFLVQSRGGIALILAAPDVTLRLIGMFTVVLSLRIAVNIAVNQAVSLATASMTILSKVAALSWLRSWLAWWASQAALLLLLWLLHHCTPCLCPCSLSLKLMKILVEIA